jgi:hypothetical protein
MGYNTFAVLDGASAVPCDLQPAIAGSNAPMRLRIMQRWAIRLPLRTGSRAIESHETRQVRKEAAVSGQTV